MKPANYIVQRIIGLTLPICASIILISSVMAAENTTQNPSLEQYIPIAKTDADGTTSYVFIDKQSIKIHPYNKLIRTYNRVINYTPALSQTLNDSTFSYQSKVVQELVNCDKKEYTQISAEMYENEFGGGTLYYNADLPKRWQDTVNNHQESKNLIIVCSLPINE